MQVQLQNVFLLAAVLAVAASLLIWTMVAYRAIQGIPTLPYQPRRRVPWRWSDWLMVFLAYFALAECVALLDDFLFGLKTASPATSGNADELKTAHPLVVLLYADRSVWTLLLSVLVGIVVAPIIEEFLFRLLLQGWLEAVESRVRRRIVVLRRLVPGTAPVLVTSLLFGAMHYRALPPEMDPDWLARMFARGALVGLLTLAVGVWLVRFRTGATACDFGFVPSKLWADVGLGLLAFSAVAAPIYLLQFVLKLLLPEDPVVDPITLFFLAMVLGTLYYRTHRIVPSIVLHMALNATSLAMAWYYFAQ